MSGRLLPPFRYFFLTQIVSPSIHDQPVHSRKALWCHFLLSLRHVTSALPQRDSRTYRSLDGARSGERATHCDTPVFVPLDGDMCDHRQKRRLQRADHARSCSSGVTLRSFDAAGKPTAVLNKPTSEPKTANVTATPLRPANLSYIALLRRGRMLNSGRGFMDKSSLLLSSSPKTTLI